jgi:hypothetical protein
MSSASVNQVIDAAISPLLRQFSFSYEYEPSELSPTDLISRVQTFNYIPSLTKVLKSLPRSDPWTLTTSQLDEFLGQFKGFFSKQFINVIEEYREQFQDDQFVQTLYQLLYERMISEGLNQADLLKHEMLKLTNFMEMRLIREIYETLCIVNTTYERLKEQVKSTTNIKQTLKSQIRQLGRIFILMIRIHTIHAAIKKKQISEAITFTDLLTLERFDFAERKINE